MRESWRGTSSDASRKNKCLHVSNRPAGPPSGESADSFYRWNSLSATSTPAALETLHICMRQNCRLIDNVSRTPELVIDIHLVKRKPYVIILVHDNF